MHRTALTVAALGLVTLSLAAPTAASAHPLPDPHAASRASSTSSAATTHVLAPHGGTTAPGPALSSPRRLGFTAPAGFAARAW